MIGISIYKQAAVQFCIQQFDLKQKKSSFLQSGFYFPNPYLYHGVISGYPVAISWSESRFKVFIQTKGKDYSNEEYHRATIQLQLAGAIMSTYYTENKCYVSDSEGEYLTHRNDASLLVLHYFPSAHDSVSVLKDRIMQVINWANQEGLESVTHKLAYWLE